MTTDPEAALEGSILPFGGIKGYLLAFMIEILTGPLVSAGYGLGVTGTSKPTEDCTKGDLFIAIDPSKFVEREVFEEHKVIKEDKEKKEKKQSQEYKEKTLSNYILELIIAIKQGDKGLAQCEIDEVNDIIKKHFKSEEEQKKALELFLREIKKKRKKYGTYYN